MRTRLALLCLLLTPGIAADERLSLPAPEGWSTVYALETDLMRLSEFAAPTGDPAVRDKYSFEWFAHDLATEVDPIGVAGQLATAVRAGCREGRDQGVFAGYENGYPTVVRLYTCPLGTEAGFGEVLMLKAIRGATGTWIVVRARRVPAFDDGGPALAEAEIGAWSLGLRAIRLCDPDAPEHPCGDEDDPAP